MAGDTVITVIGNLTADPELKTVGSGSAVANFTIASTPRTFNKNTNEWEDGEALFLRCSIWREAAENVGATLQKGMRVIAQGRLRSRSFDDKEGQRRTVMELEVDEIGPSLKYAQAQVRRIDTRQQGGGYQQGGYQQQPPQQGGYQQGGYPQQGGFPQQGAPQQQPPQQAPNQPNGGDPWSTGQQQPPQQNGGWPNQNPGW